MVFGISLCLNNSSSVLLSPQEKVPVFHYNYDSTTPRMPTTAPRKLFVRVM